MPTFKNDKLKRPRPRSPERARKSRGGPEQHTDSRDLCSSRGCGRPKYARGLCQTHHRQMLDAGKLKPIRPYRKRSADTVKLAGLRLTSYPLCQSDWDNLLLKD